MTRRRFTSSVPQPQQDQEVADRDGAVAVEVERPDALSADEVRELNPALPADAPNRFIINVQPDQVEPVRDFLAGQGVVEPVLYPMIRARLVEVNGKPVEGEYVVPLRFRTEDNMPVDFRDPRKL